MTKKESDYFKAKLIAEKKQLEEELNSVGRRDASKKTWEPTSTDIQVDSADDNEIADKFEEIEGNTGIVTQLENQLNEVNSALERIEKGTYGLCEKCQKPIEKERLEANPSSRISIKHGH